MGWTFISVNMTRQLFSFARRKQSSGIHANLSCFTFGSRLCHAETNVFNFGWRHTRTCCSALPQTLCRMCALNTINREFVWMRWHKIDESSNDSENIFLRTHDTTATCQHVSEKIAIPSSLKWMERMWSDSATDFAEQLSPSVALRCHSTVLVRKLSNWHLPRMPKLGTRQKSQKRKLEKGQKKG